MNLTHQDFNLFNREIFTFKQLKEQQTSAEIDDLKQTYKQHWEKLDQRLEFTQSFLGCVSQ